MFRRVVLGLVLVVALMTPLLARSAVLRPVVGIDDIHEVKPGEDLPTVARDYGLGLEHITWANGLPMQPELQPGTLLKIPGRRILPANPPSDGIVLNIPERGFYYFRHGAFVKFYPIAVGRLGFLTPRGNFHVIEKIKHPVWVPPAWAKLGNIVMQHGPDNPLGDYWIGLSAPRVGLHGTHCPESIGMAISHGCLRMYPEHVESLFNQVWIGMPVRIEYETVKLGRDRNSGKVYMAAFQDSYNLQQPLATALRLIAQAGLQTELPRSDVETMVRQSTGRALLAVGSDAMVKVDGSRIWVTIPPLARGQTLWVPAEVALAAGLDVTSTRQQVLVTHQQQKMTFSLSPNAPPVTASESEPVAYTLHGRPMLPAQTLFEYFKVPYRWVTADNTLYIDSQIGVQN